jgi:amino acid adenylation domain-containing protein
MKDISQRIAQFSPEKRRLLERLMGRPVAANAAAPIVRGDRNGKPIPLSLAQQRLWFLDQLQPGSAFYNIAAAVHLRGVLNVGALERSIAEIISRHDSLRTTFPLVEGQPVQRIAPNLELHFPVIDLTEVPVVERMAEARRQAEVEARQPFDLVNGPLIRARLLRLGEAEHVSVMTLHHLIADGWSLRVLIREVAQLYECFSAGQPSPLPELPIQYPDFADWQRLWMQGPVREAQLEYWKKQLAGAPNVLELPTDRPRPPVLTYRGARQDFALPAGLIAPLQALSREEGTTLFRTLLAAVQTLLFRYSGQDDVLVGTPVANRNRREIEPLIGFFVSTLVLRGDLSGDPTFRELLQRTRTMVQGALANHDLPFEQVVDAVQPQRDLSRTPLFQVLFAFDRDASQHLEMRGVTMTAWEIDTQTSKFDLSLSLSERPDALAGFIEYSTDLFDAVTITRLATHFQTLLEGVIADPDTPLSRLPLLPEPERRQVLFDWNATEVDFPRDICLHQLFEAQVERTPDAVALVFEDQTLSYRELNERADLVAAVLRQLGVGPDVLVGICMERSLELVIGLFGILKAGGAYVPLDPEYPRDRLAFMLADSRVPVLLTQRRLVPQLPDHQAQILCLDESLPQTSGASTRQAPTADHLAYMIYTSGSTGQPKGSLIPHRGIVNRLVWMQKEYQLTEADRVLQKTPFSFDVSVWEFFWPLMTGAQLVLARPGGHRDNAYLVRLIAEQRVTVLHFVPSMLQVFLEEKGLETCASLRHVICSGEALPWELQERFFARLAAELHNLYGPTEASVDVTYWRCRRGSSDRCVPIGRPIDNTQMLVLDAHHQPAPLGVPGELYIGGVGLARGYLNRAELTAEKFIRNPVPGAPSERLYRTGDRARWRPDGALEFLGRLDFQVKIRGFRIELGEIEFLLTQHPMVREAVVLAREDRPGEKRLVAYVVPRGAGADVQVPLHAYLKAKLPEYMVPSAFVILETLPLTPSGKLDRRALPSPKGSFLPVQTTDYVAPRNPTEELLAGLFAQVLGRECLGIHDDFFAWGGDSLRAAQLVVRVRDAFSIDLPLRALFENPTVVELAQVVAATRTPDTIPPLRPAPADAPPALSFAQQRLWFLDQLQPGSPQYTIAAALRLNGALLADALRRSLEEIVRRHQALRTHFIPVSGQPVPNLAPVPPLTLEAVDLSVLPPGQREDELQRLAAEEARRPFDLTRGPLLCGRLFRLQPTEHVLVVTIHHIAADGWSLGVFIRELAALYEAFAAGRPSPLPELPIQYGDYGHWQRQWLQGAPLEKQLTYWQKQLANAAPALELPIDRPRPAVPLFRGALLSVHVPQALTDRLRALSRQEGATLYMTLLAAFQTLLHRYSDQDDILVGSPVAHRSRRETEALIGFFVNTLVMRGDLAGDPSFRALLRRTRETVLEALANQDLPFEQVVEAVQPHRDLSRTPLFQVLFVLQNAPMPALQLAGLRVGAEEVHTGTAKFELTLSLSEVGDGLRGALEYSTDLFDLATVTRLASHLQILLEGIAADPDRGLSALPLLPDSERAQVLTSFNPPLDDYPRTRTIHELFEEQVARTPYAVALVFGDRQWTYAELNRRANQVAHRLRRIGVRPDERVGLFAERSLELLAGLLGILKVGAAYVPLDPNYPSQRLAVMLADAGLRVLLTQQHLRDVLALKDREAIEVLYLDDAGLWNEPDTANLPTLGTAESLAYVMYTSGSTGQPKGIEIPHRGVLRLVRNTNYLQPTPDDVFLQLAPIAFDASTFEIWAALLNGARLVIMPPHELSLAELGQSLRRHRVTVLWLTAGLFHLMVDERLEDLKGLRALLAGGDVLSLAHVRKVHQELGDGRLINGYGPTENTTFTTTHTVNAEIRDLQSVPIGRPISHTRVYILDRHLQPTPIGVPGELYIGGDGLARGYLNRPELSAEKFILNPLPGITDERLYRTGDRVRWRPDGTVEFLGRLDHQVKIRGFRIELGEIEAVLLQHAAVREAAVLACADSLGDKQLVAYVAPRAGMTIEVENLRAFLKERLPEYMVPSAFVTMDALPLTPSGKVSRTALAAPNAELLSATPLANYAAPRNPGEELLAGLFAQVLGRDRIGIHDDFFASGGHSLRAAQLAVRIRDAFAVDLPLRALFEHPTVAALAQVVAAGRTAPISVALTPTSAGAAPVLSFAQQRLWFLDQLEPGSPHYTIAAALRLHGLLLPDALGRALEEIVRRHQALRTFFTSAGGQPVPILSPPEALPLDPVDLQALSPGEREGEVQRLAAEEARRPFDLSSGPLLRVRLLRLATTEHVLAVTVHHIAADGWSLGVFIRELAVLYDAFAVGRPSPLPELPVQYADYALRQRQRLQGETLEEQLTYWKGQLGGAATTLELPTDRPRPPVPSFRGALVPVALPRELTERLRVLSQREGTTLYMTLLAAFQTLLHRYSGQDDILVGSPVANRTCRETELMIGFFVNTLVLRGNLSDNLSFRAFLHRTRETALGALAHQDLPFEQLVDAVQPERDLSRSPLFQVMFILQNAPMPALELAGLRVSGEDVHTGTSKFDMTLSLTDGENGLHGTLEYSTDLFDAATMDRLLSHFQTLLEGVVDDPDQVLSSLPLVPCAERRTLLVDWNATWAEYPRDRCLHHLFEAQARRRPNAVAVSFQGRSLTYAELDRKADQLACRLRSLGVGPDVLVGICLERSLEMVIGLLGILKAGGAYVPLDPDYPRERLQLMIADGGMDIFVTQSALRDLLPGDRHLLCLDEQTLWEQPAEPFADPGTTSEHLAYLLFTSGSTGRPKGVQVLHRGVVNCLCSFQKTPGLTEEDVLLAVTTLSFDIACVEIFLPLSVGARLVLVPREEASDGDRLLSRLNSSGTTVMQATPATWQLLLRSGWSGTPGLKVFSGGEAMSVELARQLRARADSVWNLYGPTESTIWSSLHRVDADEDPVSIGRPIANTQMVVLDAHQQPAPIGVAGELYIGGDGLARGYLNRPELTAEKFVVNPLPTIPSARLYRTGDRARWRADGTLEFQGRLDHQVKIRGFRIELGEIESVLSQHPTIGQAVVVVREVRPGDQRLVAYLTPRAAAPAEASVLRAFLKEKLPEYMLPSAFVTLETFPLTPSGKIDRRALPAPAVTPTDGAEGMVPRTPVEDTIAGIWAQVLGVEKVGIHEHFFELGGHSLLATQAISRIRETFQVSLPLRVLFEAPTVAGLAERIESACRDVGASPFAALQPVERGDQLPLSFGQETLWFLDQLVPGSPAFNTYLALRLKGPLDVEALRRSLSAIVQRHESLRTTFATAEGKPTAVIAADPPQTMSVIDLSDLPEDERAGKVLWLADEEARQPFDLARGPLCRTRLLRLDNQEHVLLATVHHIVSDGWSLGVFVQELAALYQADVFGRPPSLPALPIQYVDFAHWQRQWLQSEQMRQQLDYWKRQLGGPLPVLKLPTDHPRQATRTFRGRRQTLDLPADLTRALKALSQREGTTLYMTLLAAFQTLLHRYSGQDDILVGSPVANRTSREIEPLIGFFVNTLVLRGDLSGDPTFRELLGRTRETALAAYAHQELPFEKVMEAIRPARDLSHSAVFQVMFVVQNAPLQIPALSGMTVTPLPLADNETAKFELTLAFSEIDDWLAGSLEYNRDLFEPATIGRLIEHFRTLLVAVLADPERRLSQLPLLPETERRQLLVDWQGPTAPFPKQTIHELFEAQVRRTPDDHAVEQDGRTWTYAELNRRANQLAHQLRSQGVGPNGLVGLCLERSPELIAGLLAVLKAGGAYVPLDPSYPKQRLRDMVTDSGLSVLLTQRSLQDVVPAEGVQVICVEESAAAEESADDLAPAAAANDAAYVIYTSGSSGKPKGAVISHSALVNYTQQARAIYGVQPDDRVLQFASVSFDASAEEIYPCLTSGATLVLRTEAMLNSMALFLTSCRDWNVSVVSLPTAFWHELTAALQAESLTVLPLLRLVILGGERALPERLARWREHVGPSVRLINTYGPTEATVVATWSDLTTCTVTGELPIGRPLGNVQAYVLDSALNPVPVGVPGELCIGGAGLARGYLNRPELTAEKFVRHPLVEDATVRLYRTGDRVRWLPDGQLEFLGRIDQQVKIRGFRIEPGEIEAVLARHPVVRESAVLAREDTPGEMRLVAYVASQGTGTALNGDLRAFLKERLPDYMVPAVFVTMDTLPLTSNGKIDRRALPAPERSRAEDGSTYVAPRNLTEEILAGIWAHVLGLDKVSVHDNFFELGGQSLQAMQLVAKIYEATQRAVSVKSIFVHPTVAGFAEMLEKTPPADRPAESKLVVPAPSFQREQPALSPYLHLEKRSLVHLFAAGKVAPVQAAALSYFPSSLLQQTGLSANDVIHNFCGDLPLVSNIQDTPLGRIASILLPRFEFQLYQDRDDLLAVIGDALHLAGTMGAHTVSLTGLLPSATDYGRAVLQATAGRDLPAITTGHATTSAGLLLALRRLLGEAGRDFSGERVSFLGLGSVGQSILRLALARLPHPAEINLCEVPRKRAELEALRREIVEQFGYRRPVRLLTAESKELPEDFYDASCVIAATNARDLIDIARLQPGTLLFDDSAPTCFSTEAALRRLNESCDILFTVSDQMRAPVPMEQTIYLPPMFETFFASRKLELLARYDPHQITGCVFSSILSARHEHLPPTIGLTTLDDCLRHDEMLMQLGFQSAKLHVEETPLDREAIERFRARFGGACHAIATRSECGEVGSGRNGATRSVAFGRSHAERGNESDEGGEGGE